MPIFGSSLTKDGIRILMQNKSTEIHQLISSIKYLEMMFEELNDDELKNVFVSAGDSQEVADGLVVELRNWLSAINGFVQNYSGAGVVLNRSSEISKRIII